MAFVAIGLFLTILFGGVFIGVYAFRPNNVDVVELRSGSVRELLTETGSGSCVWSVLFTLLPDLSLGVDLDDVSIVTSPAGVPVDSITWLRSSSDPAETFGQVGYEFESCPGSVDDIDHSGLIVRYTTFGSGEVLVKSLGW